MEKFTINGVDHTREHKLLVEQLGVSKAMGHIQRNSILWIRTKELFDLIDTAKEY